MCSRCELLVAAEQVRQLLLDPGVAREFERLKKDNEAKAAEIKALKEELQAVGFSQESKAGRMLMLKCRALQVLLCGAVVRAGQHAEGPALTACDARCRRRMRRWARSWPRAKCMAWSSRCAAAGEHAQLACSSCKSSRSSEGSSTACVHVHLFDCGPGMQVALAKGFVDDMRARFLELDDHAHALHGENEDLCREVTGSLLQEVPISDTSAADSKGVSPNL